MADAPTAVVAMDYDADGDADVYIAYDSVPNVLLRNDGAGNLTQVHGVGRLTSNADRTRAAHALDVNGDGTRRARRPRARARGRGREEPSRPRTVGWERSS